MGVVFSIDEKLSQDREWGPGEGLRITLEKTTSNTFLDHKEQNFSYRANSCDTWFLRYRSNNMSHVNTFLVQADKEGCLKDAKMSQRSFKMPRFKMKMVTNCFV